MHALVNGYRVPLDVSFALRATGDHGARFLTARSRGALCLSAHDPAAAAAPLCQRRETGGLSAAHNNSAARNILARNRPAVGNREARNTHSRRAAPP